MNSKIFWIISGDYDEIILKLTQVKFQNLSHCFHNIVLLENISSIRKSH